MTAEIADEALTAFSVERLPAVLRYRGLEKQALAMQQRLTIENLRQDLARLSSELQANSECSGVRRHG